MTDFIQFVSNNWLLWSAFFVVLAVFAITELKAVKRGPTKISPQEAILLINKENALVIDVRDITAYAKGHIVGAKNIARTQLQNQLPPLEKYKTRPIITVCDAGHQSTLTGIEFKRNGFERVYNLAGGLNAWITAGLPLEKK